MTAHFETRSQLLLVCEYATISGGEQSMLATLEEVLRAGIDVAVVAPAEGPLSEALAVRGVEVVPFAFRDAGGSRLPLGQLRTELARLLGARRPDVLHANSLSMGRLCGPVAAELAVTSIAHLRDIIKLSARATSDLNRNTRLVAVSEATRRFHVVAGVAGDKTHVLYNGVDLDRFRPRRPSGRLHRELGLSAEIHLVGTVGQICLRKGQDVFVHAATMVSRARPDVHFLIVGERWSEKPESRRFEAALRAASTGPLAGRLHFLGYRDDIDRILGELSVLVHPARQEPLGRVLLEAAAAGIAVVATEVGGTAEIFPLEVEAARLVPPDDPEAIAAGVLEFVDDETLRARRGMAARRRAEEAFSAGQAAEGLIEHYRQVVAR